MGICVNCGREIVLRNGEIKCPNCGKSMYYCWNCNEKIDGSTLECCMCHYFECPKCGKCGENCRVEEIAEDSGATKELVRKIVEFISKPSPRFCPLGVPMSYAKGKIRKLILKTEGGFFCKSEEDRKVYENRINKIGEFPIGTKWTITKIREEGFGGQEERDASNLAVCLGKAMMKTDKREDGTEYDYYERVNLEPCGNFSNKNLISKFCPRCEKTFSKETEYCDVCVYKKGKNKNEPVKLKFRKSRVETCKCKRKFFTEKKEKK